MARSLSRYLITASVDEHGGVAAGLKDEFRCNDRDECNIDILGADGKCYREDHSCAAIAAWERRCFCYDAHPQSTAFETDPRTGKQRCVNRLSVRFRKPMTVRQANDFARTVLGGSLARLDLIEYEFQVPSRTLRELKKLLAKARAHPLVEHADDIHWKENIEINYNLGAME